MAFSSHSQAGGRGSTLADINVTPMVDVMLVLLVIFMITVPVIQSGIEVQVPRTHNTQQLTQPLLVVTVNRDGNVYIGDQLTNLTTIAKELKQRMPDPSQQDIYLRADERISWGLLARVMDAIQTGGLSKVKMVTEPYDGTPGQAEVPQ